MEQFNEVIGKILGVVWGPWLPVVLVGTGVWLTFWTGGIQVRKFGYACKQTFGKLLSKGESGAVGTLKPFQATATALSSTIGVGNIVGVASAVTFGGPGAVFWMWVSAFFGMCTKFAEVTLAQHYREKDAASGEWIGGPNWYVSAAFHTKAVGKAMAVMGLLTILGSGAVQSNSLAGSLSGNFGIPLVVSGIAVIIFTALVVLGGLKRLGKFAEMMVPFMVLFYLIVGLIVIISHISALPAAIAMIFKGAFTPISVASGYGGYAIAQAIQLGVARGLYSNEAGMGSAAVAHATAITDHPVRQGLWGIFEVFMDTFVVCTFTALVILCSGLLTPNSDPSVLTAQAFGTVLPAAQYIVGAALALFAYTTIVAIWYYGMIYFRYLLGRGGGKITVAYTVVYLVFVFFGVLFKGTAVWAFSDVMFGISIIPNLLALIILAPLVRKLTKDFFSSDLAKK